MLLAPPQEYPSFYLGGGDVEHDEDERKSIQDLREDRRQVPEPDLIEVSGIEVNSNKTRSYKTRQHAGGEFHPGKKVVPTDP